MKNEELLYDISFHLQGRPTFLASFLRRLKTATDINKVFQEYYKEMTTDLDSIDGFGQSLYQFWKIWFNEVISPLSSTRTNELEFVWRLLMKLYVSNLFGDGKSIDFDPSYDMIETGLVTVTKQEYTWSARMAEPMTLTAGLNLLSSFLKEPLIDYFASQLFTRVEAPNFTAQERSSIMELVIALRFRQEWWYEPEAEGLLPEWVENQNVDFPQGINDCRLSYFTKRYLFIEQLSQDGFPWVVLPGTKAGPDIRYLFFCCYIKITFSDAKLECRCRILQKEHKDCEYS